MKTDFSLETALDDINWVREKLIATAKEHPTATLSAAAGIGFAVGCFGVKRILAAGTAYGVHEKISWNDLKGFLDNGFKNLKLKEA